MKRQTNEAISWLKNVLIAYSVLTLLAHTAKPLQVFAAESLDQSQTGTQMVSTAETAPASSAASEAAQTTQDVLLDVCQSRGYGEGCAKHLLGILWKESNNVSTAVGDRGQARGYFQIHYKLHKISVGCAEDLRCSADWTLTYLERNFYPKYVSYAIQCHNGCNFSNGYVSSVLYQGKRLWNQPLPLNDVQIALK